MLILVAAVALGSCGDSGNGGGAKKPAKAVADTATPVCKRVAKPAPKGPQHLAKPHGRLDRKHTYVVHLVTNCGEIEITLATHRAPKTANGVAYLVRKHFYDGLTFHRIAHGLGGSDFVIQGGDPVGNGQGGPGYRIVEAPPSNVHYTRGVVAMAKTEADPPGTSGSQFYIVTAEDAGLPPQYALLGEVTKGDDVVSRIAATKSGPPPDEHPLQPIVIEHATLEAR
jgi:peptidyl-prolyl cis-trans isomerase B (cyclophilin B)